MDSALGPTRPTPPAARRATVLRERGRVSGPFVPNVNASFQSACSPVEHNQDDPDNRHADADDEQEPRIGGGPLGVDEECHHRRHEAGDDQEPGEGLLHVRPQCTGSAARVAKPIAARKSWPRWSSTCYSIT
jgi:hypothetical protein